MLRRLAAVSGGVVVLHHVWLLVGDASSGQLAEPWLLLRWFAACGIAIGLGGLRRSGWLFRGRSAVALWLFAGLLHAPAAIDSASRLNTLALPEAATTVVQLVAQCAVAGLGVFLLTVARRAWRPRQIAWGTACSGLPLGPLSAGFAPWYFARPPPVS